MINQIIWSIIVYNWSWIILTNSWLSVFPTLILGIAISVHVQKISQMLSICQI